MRLMRLCAAAAAVCKKKKNRNVMREKNLLSTPDIEAVHLILSADAKSGVTGAQ